MREIRTSGSEGGAGREPRSYLYPGGLLFGTGIAPRMSLLHLAWRALHGMRTPWQSESASITSLNIATTAR